MTSVDFPQANKTFDPPADLDPQQCRSIRAFLGTVPAGSVEGAPLVITCWRPNHEEIEAMIAGSPIFLSVLGGLPPHFLTTSFEQAINPA